MKPGSETGVLSAVNERRLADLMGQLYQLKLRGFTEVLPGARWQPSWDRSGHYLVLRRGPLLVVGKWEPEHYFVLTTQDARVIPGHLQCQVQLAPGANGDAVPVLTTDAGPWWEMLAQELPTLELALCRFAAQVDQQTGRVRQLTRAREAVRQFLQEAI